MIGNSKIIIPFDSDIETNLNSSFNINRLSSVLFFNGIRTDNELEDIKFSVWILLRKRRGLNLWHQH